MKPMTNPTPLRLILLGMIAVYFAWAGLHSPATVATPNSTAQQATQAPSRLSQPPTSTDCHSHIREATASTGELRLKVDGAAEVIRVSYDGGMLLRPTEEVCSAGFCRVFTPSAPKLVQLDRCPAISLPWPQ